MRKRLGDIFADYMKLEFEYDDQRIKERIVIIRALWWNAQHGEWETLQEIFLPINKIDEVIKILNKVKD
ncbi:MAG: hypothetical protein QW416_07575 [Candidatus Nitrosocaldaceae archaeon]